MASIKFGGLILGVIIVSLALKYSSAACAQEGVQRKAKWLPSSIGTGNHASSQNMAKINAARKVLVGRNTQKGDDGTDHHEEKEGSSNYPKPEISGNDAPKKSIDGAESTSYKNTQDNSNVEYSSKNRTYLPPKRTPILSREHHHQSSSAHHQKENYPKDFLETIDDDDVMNLMRRDYRGTDRPRRKPPINNHEPSD